MAAGARPDLARARRAVQVSLPLDTEIVLLRDRAPLHAPNVELTGGRTCEDVVVVHDLDNSVELGADVSCRLK